ncbi:hypothetical protein ARAM_002691 [Aspergillus rambellii]|uniref:Probable aspartate--tRNA ligase, cytoplasmic n=1 Tax=Aspergillus rambellii TaxID=308745 RepID=A0A0F8WLU0_9EURO|nr:hypothetical protein ARAM_002691 [Aspergillus rambellii]
MSASTSSTSRDTEGSHSTGSASWHFSWHRILPLLKRHDHEVESDEEPAEYPPGSQNQQRRRPSRDARKEAAASSHISSRTGSSLPSQPAQEESWTPRRRFSPVEESPETKHRYGDLPLVQSQDIQKHTMKTNLIPLHCIAEDLIEHSIAFRARVHTVRRMSANLLFLLFRREITTVQGVLSTTPGVCSAQMVEWARHLSKGTIVEVHGVVCQPQHPITGATFPTMEVCVERLYAVIRCEENIPFSVYEAELCPEELRGARDHWPVIPDHTRLQNRILDLRTQTSQSIFRIQAAICKLFRECLDRQGFLEIHTPKLQSTATESRASVFGVQYFDRTAYLAQSSQLAKQMAIAADFDRVYEIGAAFRAENANTAGHLTEYTGLDIEMTIDHNYHEMLEILDSVLKNIFAGIYQDYRRELGLVKTQFLCKDLVWLDRTPILQYKDAIRLLNDSGWLNEDRAPLSDDEGLCVRDELRLGELVKSRYGTDYYILDKFPKSARPFYTMPSPLNPEFTNSFDMFVRGQEIASGGQRIHDFQMLKQSLQAAGIQEVDLEEYMQGLRLAASPHAGAGIGLERLLMLVLDLKDIRLASLFHRDSKSFPATPSRAELRHPGASTLRLAGPKKEALATALPLPALEDLVANYGDAASTSWSEARYQIWRDPATGAAISYVPLNGRVIIPGNPLCDPGQSEDTIQSFLVWLNRHHTKRKPIWMLISGQVEAFLCDKLGWSSFSCVAEDRITPAANSAASMHRDLARKLQHVKHEGVRVISLPQGQSPDDDTRGRIDRRIQDWLQTSSHGDQMHLSRIDPWRDPSHRWYFYAVDRQGVVCAFVGLAMLATWNGWQIKYSWDFPDSPSGAIEWVINHAIQTAASKVGGKSLTFGPGATARLRPGHVAKGNNITALEHTYQAVVAQFHLTRKSEFRFKLGASEDPLWIAYPRGALGSRGIRAILEFFKE